MCLLCSIIVLMKKQPVEGCLPFPSITYNRNIYECNNIYYGSSQSVLCPLLLEVQLHSFAAFITLRAERVALLTGYLKFRILEVSDELRINIMSIVISTDK